MKLYTYRFSDGMEIQREACTKTMEEIAEIEHHFGNKLVFNGYRDHLESIQLLRTNSHSTGDGFKPGWHPGLGMEIRTNGQYQTELKARGMIEVGNETQKRAPMKKEGAFTEEIIKEAISMGAEISGNEAAKLTGAID